MEQRQICVVVVSSRYGCFGGNKCCSEHSRDHVLSVMGKPNAWLEAVSSGKMSIPSHKCCILINRALCTAHCLEYLYAHNNSWSCQRWKFSKPVGNSQRKLWNGFDKQSFALFSSLTMQEAPNMKMYIWCIYLQRLGLCQASFMELFHSIVSVVLFT